MVEYGQLKDHHPLPFVPVVKISLYNRPLRAKVARDTEFAEKYFLSIAAETAAMERHQQQTLQFEIQLKIL